jgi:hypothetical protein
MKRTLLILGLAALLVGGATLPALARDGAVVERTRSTRTFPPAWVAMSIVDLQAEVGERAARAIARTERSPWLSDEEKAELLAAIEGLTGAVGEADSNAEVIGISISRVQLQRSEMRAERRGEAFDHDAHIAGDADRAARRLERLAKVATWAAAAGEDVAAVESYLDEAAGLLEAAYGDGTVVDRHDAVHISLAWLVEAGVALDRL